MFLPELLNLGAGFQKYFEVVPATSETLRRECYRIRHEVYCRDLGFEPLRPDGLESDEHDRHSLHCLLRTVGAGRYIGNVRIVLARPEDPSYPLPFESTCAKTLDRSIIDPARLDRSRIAEVSRLAVIGHYRRRQGEASRPIAISDSDYGDEKRPRLPYVPLGLYLGIIALAHRHGIETLFVLTEPRLAAHFSRLGVKVDTIGGPTEHRGIRIPSMMSVQGIVDGMSRFVKPLYRVIAQEIDTAFAQQRLAG